jgi:predicted alpha/beta-hydrolase family hydrolase
MDLTPDRKGGSEAETQELQFAVEQAGEVSAIFNRPANMDFLLVLAHGAGAGMRHIFLESLTRELANQGVGVLRYQFPYLEQRRKIPDSPAVLTSTVRAAVQRAAELAPEVPLFAGGKSMGGRMTSTAASQAPLPGVHGLVFFGFPLHPPGRPGTTRAAHLSKVTMPMLFLQGTRDTLAQLDLLRPICDDLGERATLKIFDTADHSFKVLKSSGLSNDEVLSQLAASSASWARAQIAKGP